MRGVKWAGVTMLQVGALWCAPALAQSASGGPPASSPQPDKQRAFDLFEAGKAAYRRGRFQDAVDELRQAYALSHEPVLRYDLARAYEGLGDLDGAAREYEAYLAEAPSIPDRAGIAQRVATLRQELAERERLLRAQKAAEQRAESTRAAPSAAKTDAAEPPPKSVGRPWPWVLVGIGAGGLAAGGVMSAVALSYHSDAGHPGATQQAVADDNDRASGWITAARIAFVAGGVAAAAGLTWWFFTRDRDDATMVRAGLRLSPRDASLYFEGF